MRMPGKLWTQFVAMATWLLANDAVASSDVNTVIQQYVDDARARVVVVAEIRGDDETIHVAGGHGDVAAREALFEIGSISKVFTALLAQVQVDAGGLDWGATLGDVMADVEFASEAVAAITLRQLATHTSGLPRLPDNLSLENSLDPYADYALTDLVEFLERFAPEDLDNDYVYSNLGAGLLGVVAADAADASFGDAMQDQVLAPLAMQSSTVGLTGVRDARLVPGFSDGADMPNWSGFDALAGAGAIVSNIDDLLRFARMNFDDAALDGSLAAIRSAEPDAKTALGWHVDWHDAGDVYWHNGGTGGYASFLAIRPATNEAVVVLSASTEYEAVTALGIALINNQPLAGDATALQRFAGVYELSPGLNLTLFVEDGRLFGQATGQAAFPLTQDGALAFDYAAANIRLEFPHTGDDPVDSVDFKQGSFRTTAPRLDDKFGVPRPSEIDVSAEALRDYEGEYRLAPGVKLTVTRHESQLFAQLSGQQAFPVFAYDTDKFFYRVVDARLQFERDDSGLVVAVILDQAGKKRLPRIEN